MVYKFRIVSDEVDNFRREIEIDADSTFLSLRNAICDAVGYDKNQMSSFFICDDNWEKDVEITLEDMGSDSSEDVYLMEDSIISDFVEDEGQRLLFVFDYLTDRCFFMELKETEPGKNMLDPLCTEARGKAPVQLMDITEFEEKNVKADTATTDMDADFYGSTDYTPDEFDTEGFDEMTFEQ